MLGVDIDDGYFKVNLLSLLTFGPGYVVIDYEC